MDITPALLEVSAQAMVRMLWREFEKRKPQGPNPVPTWEDMRPIDRQSFLRVTAAALQAAKANQASVS